MWQRRFMILPAMVAIGSMVAFSAQAKLAPKVHPRGHWRDLASPHYVYPGGGAIYYSFQAPNGSRAHLIVVNLKEGKWQIRPAIAEGTAATSEIANKACASAAVNGGFFNLSDGASTSYIVIDGKQVADPTANKALVENAKLAPFLQAIFNRSEIRFLEKGNQRVISIARHSDPVSQGWRLAHALQAGPRLLPESTESQEAFVRKESDGTNADSIGTRKTAARTAFGITDDGYAMLLAVAGNGQEEYSSGITLAQLATMLKELGCSQAINLDGGASTTMFVRLSAVNRAQSDMPPGTVVCGKSPETRVKSALILESLTIRK